MGSWIVEGMLPFFRTVLLITTFTFTIAAATETSLSLIHVLLLPSIAGVIYAIINVKKRIKQEEGLSTRAFLIISLVIALLSVFVPQVI